jgi:hypothetical protein
VLPDVIFPATCERKAVRLCRGSIDESVNTGLELSISEAVINSCWSYCLFGKDDVQATVRVGNVGSLGTGDGGSGGSGGRVVARVLPRQGLRLPTGAESLVPIGLCFSRRRARRPEVIAQEQEEGGDNKSIHDRSKAQINACLTAPL